MQRISLNGQAHKGSFEHYSDIKHPAATELKLTQDYSYYPVQKVYDGDTVLLTDGRKIRLVGINTPEIEHPRQAAQAGGGAALQWLTQQLETPEFD